MDENLKIAVIIPAHNESKVILSTLQALFRADFAPSDIFVVDDGSSDNSAEIAMSAGVNVLPLKKNLGKSWALFGLLYHFNICDRYKWVVFLDADTLVDKDLRYYFWRAAAKLHPDASLFVAQVVSRKAGLVSCLRALEYSIGQDLFKVGMSKRGLIFVSPGCASMYRASTLRALSFDGDTLAEDMDLTMQVQRRRESIFYIPEAKVYTQDPRTFKDYTKQVTRWYRGTWQVLKKYGVFSIGWKQKVDLWIIFLMLDALIFNRLVWIVGGALTLGTNKFLGLISMDVAVMFLFALYSAVRTKRIDVVWKFPVYFWGSYINPVVYFKTFLEIMIFNKLKSINKWQPVQRY